MDFWHGIRPPDGERISRLVFLAGLVIGAACFWYYYAHGLTVAHYDAKAHLLVARRLVDSLEPGYAQMGAHWLPLIHLIYLPFVIFDAQYQSGFLLSVFSVVCLALSGWLTYRIAWRMTGSVLSGVSAAAILYGNANLQYLQSCPLTEPPYMALLLLAVDSLVRWRESDHSSLPWLAAVWVSLGGLLRYEGWLLLPAVLMLLVCDAWTRYVPRRRAIRAAAVFVALFGIPAAAHFGYIWLRLGSVFFQRVAAGNPAPYMTHHRPLLSVTYHLAQISQMAALLPLLLAAVGLVIFLLQRERFKFRLPLMLLWVPSIINIAALYWGHVYRLRYSVLLIPAVAILGSLVFASKKARERAFLLLLLTAMVLPWFSGHSFRTNAGPMLAPGPGALMVPAVGLLIFLIARVQQRYGVPLLVLCLLGMQWPPLERENRPIMGETLEHEFIEPERTEVLQYLRRHYDGQRIVIDMGRQAPLVYDLGFSVKEFIYNEGGGAFWHQAFRDPEPHAGWFCAEKGDAVWQRLQVDPRIQEKYALAVRTENFVLYRRKP